ncbi:HAD family hydrolase [Alkalibacter rhizosphaerae]|uniref:HAD family hydrolase n=1 Tax=Alkalibacter rhizosphaerae TaxID=2815577 RepID=A0A975AHF7_9FIRM|nr:HAD family hydrolase [Alkalibacter rhizosphaerae]QSX08569.1 HAD family hydrolase [Alkalibacter rhizosphaerae]
MILAFDLDGTLLDENQRIPDSTIKLLKELQKKGMQIAVATGRSYSACKYYAKLINADYVVACNGALIVDGSDDRILHKKPIPKETAEEVLSLLYAHGDKLKIQWDSFETYYTNSILPFEQEYVDAFLRHYPDEIFSMEVVDSLAKWEYLRMKKAHKEIYQIFTFSMVKPPEEYEQVLAKLDCYEDIQYVDFKKSYTDVTHKNVSKGKALKFLAKKHDYTHEHVMAFGDQYNDVSMLSYAGISVAMGNADESIKDIAKHVTSSNKEGGVESFLIDFFKV